MIDVGFFNSILQTAFMGTAVLAGVYFMMRYLQKGNSSSASKELEELRLQVTKIRNMVAHPSEVSEKHIEELKYQIEKLRSSQLGVTKDQQHELVAKLVETIKTEAANEVIREIKVKAEQVFKEKAKYELVQEQYRATIGRLREELFSLSKRGNLNLSIGIMITIVGLGLLGVFVMSFETKEIELSSFLIDFFPRISLVLLIEVFAYFFLSLYKTSLSEIKYFQNEVTSMESKYLALQVAIESGDSANITHVIEQLSKSERNFILEKGQTTVELERAKNDQQSTSDILSKVALIFRNKP